MKTEIELSHDCIEEIVRQSLIHTFAINDTIEDDYSRKLHKALKKVIRHYSNPDQWEDFKDKFNV
jgi:predicted house-cleaning noncanonical NTP pyrophosphatase (MazG superfamily)